MSWGLAEESSGLNAKRRHGSEGVSDGGAELDVIHREMSLVIIIDQNVLTWTRESAHVWLQ